MNHVDCPKPLFGRGNSPPLYVHKAMTASFDIRIQPVARVTVLLSIITALGFRAAQLIVLGQKGPTATASGCPPPTLAAAGETSNAAD